MYRARSVARIALSIIFRVDLYSSRDRPLRIWFPWTRRHVEVTSLLVHVPFGVIAVAAMLP